MSKLLKQMIRPLIKQIINVLKPLSVNVYWEEATFVHRAWNVSDALHIASLYPNTCYIRIDSRMGKLLCTRMNQEIPVIDEYMSPFWN